MSNHVGKVIFGLLSSNSLISASFSNRIYPIIVPKSNTNTTCMVYETTDVVANETKDGPSRLDVYSVTITHYNERYDKLESNNANIRAALDGVRKSTQFGVNVDTIIFVGEDEGLDEKAGLFQKSINIKLRIKR